jgi:endonuclease/exonuclease/phosphatase family metal-dependent hydrolase
MKNTLLGIWQMWQQWALTVLVTLFGLQLLRVLFPTFVFYLRDFQNVSPVTLAPIAIGVFALSFLAWPLAKLDVPLALILTGGGVALFRLLVQLSNAPESNLFFGSAGVALFLMYLPLALSHALAGKAGDTAHFGLALLLGVTLDTAVHSALLTYDLAWHKGIGAILLVVGLILLMLAALRPHFKSDGPLEPFDLPWRKALPFAALGPWFFLQLVVFQNVARLAAVSGWPLPAAGLMVTLGNVVGLGLALLIIRNGIKGYLLILVMGLLFVVSLFFTETILFPSGLLPAVAQIVSSGLLMVLFVNLGGGQAAAGLGRLGVANGIGQLLLIILGFAYYVSYDIPTGFRPTAVLPVAGVLVLAGVLAAAGSREPVTRPAIGNAALYLGIVLLLLPLSTWLNWQNLRTDETPDSAGPLRVMSFNVHNGFSRDGRLDLEAIAQVIEESGADVIGLQEVSRGWLINGSADMVQWLSQRLGMAYLFGPTEGALWGNALLSRYPIIQARSLSLPPDTLRLRRGYIQAEVDTGAAVLMVTVTHLHHRPEDSDIRQGQMAWVLDGQPGERGLIIGDLNAHPDSAEMALMNRDGWVDVVRTLLPPASYTFPSERPSRQLDYIWLTPDLAFSEVTVIDTTASDHLPVMVEIGE